MTTYPTRPSLQRSFREGLGVPQAPSRIESEQGIIPVVIVNPSEAPAYTSQAERGTTRGRLYTGTASGTGWLLLHTVPTGKRYRIFTMRFRVSSGTMTFTDFGLLENGQISQVVVNTVSSSTSAVWNPGQTLPLNAGDSIYVYVDSAGVPGNIQVTMWYTEEEAY